MPNESYRTILEKISRTKSSLVSVFADFCRISACALAAQSREDEYLEVIKPYSKEELQLFAKAFALLIQEAESNPFADVLGEYYIEIAAHSSKQARGEFYTPSPISELMAKISVNADEVIEKGNPITVSEPACGAGGMVLAIAKQFSPIVRNEEKSHVDLLRVTCQDINPVGVDACFINTTLWGIPAKMILGNTLSMTVQKEWCNLHWHRVREEQRQHFLRTLEFLRTPSRAQDTERLHRSESEPSSKEFQQAAFDFDLGSISNTQTIMEK